MFLEALTVLADSGHPLWVEVLVVRGSGRRPLDVTVAALRAARTNHRIRDYPDVAAFLCARLVASSDLPDGPSPDLVRALADEAGVAVHDVCDLLVATQHLTAEPFKMQPRAYADWLAALVDTMASLMARPGVPERRGWASQLLVALRWVASDGMADSGDEWAVDRVLTTIAWFAGTSDDPERQWYDVAPDTVLNELHRHDPLVALDVHETAASLTRHAGRTPAPWELVDRITLVKRARAEITKELFSDHDPATRRQLADAWRDAEGSWATDPDPDLVPGAWLAFVEVLAGALGVGWDPMWERKSRWDDRFFPELLQDGLEALFDRATKLLSTSGHPTFLLELSRTLARLTDREREKTWVSLFLAEAVVRMDPDLVADCPNDIAQEVLLLAPAAAQRLPAAFGETMGALAVAKHGLLWHICRNMSGRSLDEAWRDEAIRFETIVRQRAETSRVDFIGFDAT